MSTTPHLDREILTTLKDVMESDFMLLIETFVTDSRERIRNLHELVPQGDAEVIRRAAHSFKGSSSNIGASRLAELCSQIEVQALTGNLDIIPELLAEAEVEFTRVTTLLQEFIAVG
ncbi:MAG: Hpt domain-containing protein [Cellvibrio sp.]|jgi:HPt (histidine-containing phosphotransfer) domain-containing protein